MKKKFIKAAAAGFIALTALSSCMHSEGNGKNDCGKNSCKKNDCGKNSCKKSGGQVEKSWWQK
jgi:hypothetical protein